MKLELDERAIAALARSTEVRTALVEGADKILEQAQAVARAEFYKTGDYLVGLKVATVTLPDGTIAAQVQATDWKSAWAEFGWTDEGGTYHPPKAVLRRGAEQAGFTPTLIPKS